MNPIKNCSTCAWCTDQNLEDQNGICSEPHAPRNAKGEITSRTRLSTTACRHYIRAASPNPEPVTMITNPKSKPKKTGKPKTEDMLV